jgi:hypothetical protein
LSQLRPRIRPLDPFAALNGAPPSTYPAGMLLQTCLAGGSAQWGGGGRGGEHRPRMWATSIPTYERRCLQPDGFYLLPLHAFLPHLKVKFFFTNFSPSGPSKLSLNFNFFHIFTYFVIFCNCLKKRRLRRCRLVTFTGTLTSILVPRRLFIPALQ